MKKIKINGKYTDASLYAKTFNDELIAQLTELINHPVSEDSKIAIMPDTHVGKGCMIGTTMTINDRVSPSLVGSDIGCGVIVVALGKDELDLERLDSIVTNYVPLGANVHEHISRESQEFFDKNKLIAELKRSTPLYSLGTLGSGNHFISVEQSEDGENYLLIHTGSRNLGTQVADYWEKVANLEMSRDDLVDIPGLIQRLKDEGREREIEQELKKAKEINQKIEVQNQSPLAYLTGQNMEDYIHDMKITQLFAVKNREAIANAIINNYFSKNLQDFEYFHTVHNYINMDDMILRKGAISANKGEIVVIPLNMRDGSLIAIGKGNPDWNYSAPHGAGRLMSRGQAKEEITMHDFRESMKGIYTTSVNESTVDEAPFAYKDAEEIIECVEDTVEIVKHLKPIYNRKA